ncbi:hypothetical protein BXZ70DRAFT_897202 [Cristinia sonorae]|uniref:RanBP2-type domain-containing protein n=1 Tax=Cristinia sonorae TaxID=1940300 RepID=A0A8K0UK00_9AGAR|nr:hypothetical protein BXZ70DRAFT_897202 [Cristinia sonorae]
MIRYPSVEEVSPPQTQSQHTEPPRTPSVLSDDEGAATSNIGQVSRFLADKNGRPLNKVEVAGLVALLQSSVQDDDDTNPPFRFSPSPLTTPARGASPNAGFIGASSSAPAISSTSTTQTPGKSLAKNPNGVYRWQGAGSARPRTRYQSPGFGPSKSMPIRMKLSTPTEPPTTDKKRRRVGSDAESSVPQRTPVSTGQSSSTSSGPTPATSNGSAATATAPASSRPNGVAPPQTPRIRTNNLPTKPTVPAIPSPLRQTWNQNDSPSPPQPPASKPTRAANMMSELLKEVTPAPKPDFSNPYDSTGPVPAKAATRKPVVKRTRTVAATHTESKPEEKKVTDLSPQKIIEATVPQGRKRTRPRPPPSDEIPPAAEPRRSSRLKSPEPTPTANGVNGLSAATNGSKTQTVIEEDESPTKKQKTNTSLNGLLNGKIPTVTIEEVEDVDMVTSPSKVTRPTQVIEPEEAPAPRQRSQSPTSATSPTSPVRNPYGNLKSSAPKAPSKLRYSIKPEGDSDKGEEDEKDKGRSVPSFSSFMPPTASSASHSPSPISVSPSPPSEVKASVLAMAVTELPSFSFALLTSSPGAGPGPSSQKSRDAANAQPITSLPSFDFSLAARSVYKASATSSLGFNFAAAGMKTAAITSGETWECSLCMLKNPASAKEKCTVCDAPRRDKPAPASGSFNWTSAGVKPPTSSADQWQCSTCMLQNPASAAEKCNICDAPKPRPAPAAAKGGFNWAAAGLAKPKAANGANWTCGTCGLSNPASAVEKCTICDTSR